MPVSFNSPARNLFLLGSSGGTVITNFFKTILDSSTDGVFIAREIAYNYSEQNYILSGFASDSNSAEFGWFEKRDYDSETDPENPTSTVSFNKRISSTQLGYNSTASATLLDIHLDYNDNIIACGIANDVPWIAKYSNAGVLDWQSTTNSGNVAYKNVTSYNGVYYASGNTESANGDVAFVEMFDANGNPGWGKSATALGKDINLDGLAANSRGHVVAVGHVEDDSRYKGYIVKIDTSTGSVMWDKTLSSSEKQGIVYTPVLCEDVFIDDQDNIYVCGRLQGVPNGTRSFVMKLSPEGNIIWQRETADDFEYYRIKADGATGQVVVFGRYYDAAGNDQGGVIAKYSRGGDVSWRRTLFSSYAGSNFFGRMGDNGGVALDADPSFYYVLYTDDDIDGLSGTPSSYTFGKVSTSGNGLGPFEYDDGENETVFYDIINSNDRVGRLQDGSVRNDISDLITYPFNATKISFDDYATPVANKKRHMDDAGNFEYSGSPAVRTTDFQEMNLGDETFEVTEFVSGSSTPPTGQEAYTTSGNFSWTVPAGVTQVSAVVVGGGGGGAGSDGDRDEGNTGGGGGGLAYGTFAVTPGESLTVIVGNAGAAGGEGDDGGAGGDTTIARGATVLLSGGGGQGGQERETAARAGGTSGGTERDGGAIGGSSGSASNNNSGSGGGGAAGYSGNGGAGGSNGGSGSAGSGGGGAGGNSAQTGTADGGGGVGILGQGSNGAASGGGGSGGADNSGFNGGSYGGGGGARDDDSAGGGGAGGSGAARIIWGTGRSYPSTLTADQTPSSGVPGGLTEQTITKVKDLSGKGYHGTIEGATLNASGYWEFDGVNDYITTSFSSDAIASGDANSEYTLEAWIYVRTSSGTTTNADCIMGHNTNRGVGMQVGVSNGSPRINYGARYTSNFYGPTFNYNEWRHILLTRDGTDGAIAYENGVEVSRSINITDLDVEPGFTPGDFNIGYAGPRINGYFDGFIGEVRVYTRALTAAQVFQNYNSTKTKYVNEAPDTAPKIGPGIVYDSNLLLNYDFGNRATYDRAENVLRFSEDFTITGSGRWATAGNLPDANVTHNYGLSPFGEMKATRMINTEAAPRFRRWQPNVGSNGNYDTSGQWNCSVYAKALSDPCVLRINSYDGNSDKGSYFDLVDGVVTSSYGSPDGTSIEAVGNGWYRISQTTTNAAAGGDHQLHLQPGADLLVFGAQMEQGNTPGRYIKTSGTAITAPTTVKNLSSSSYTGTLDGATFNANGYMELNSTSSVINMGSANAFSGNNVSFEIWFYPETTAQSDSRSLMLSANYEGGSYVDGTVILRYDQEPFGTARMFIAQVKTGSTDEFWQHSTQYPRDNWYHVVWTWNNGTMKLYVNGSEKTLDNNTGGPTSGAILNGSGNIFIGENDTFNNTVIGDYGQVRIYNKTLSATEVSQNFNATRAKYGV